MQQMQQMYGLPPVVPPLDGGSFPFQGYENPSTRPKSQSKHAHSCSDRASGFVEDNSVWSRPDASKPNLSTQRLSQRPPLFHSDYQNNDYVTGKRREPFLARPNKYATQGVPRVPQGQNAMYQKMTPRRQPLPPGSWRKGAYSKDFTEATTIERSPYRGGSNFIHRPVFGCEF